MNKKSKLNNLASGYKFSLLESFIIRKLKSHIPPVRKGTPKGKPIGFPLNKFKASLLFLTNISQKMIAREVNISYGLLRKWTTEARFTESVNAHYREFIQLFIKNIKIRIKKHQDLMDGYLKKPIEEIARGRHPILNMDEYRDMDVYNDLLIQDIFSAVVKILENKPGKLKDFEQQLPISEVNELGLILRVVQDVLGVSKSKRVYSVLRGRIPKETTSLVRELHQQTIVSNLKCAESLLLKPHLKSRDKKMAIYIISTVRRSYEKAEVKKILEKKK